MFLIKLFTGGKIILDRIEAIKTIIEQLDDELVICNIGFPSRELYSIKDSPKHFYMLGSMGMASSIGLGLALAQDRKVVILDGDGSLLMNLGSLVTIFNQNPSNLILVVLDNECYGSTGSQCSYTKTVNLSRLAEAVGFKYLFFMQSVIDFSEVLNKDKTVFVHVKIKKGNANVPIIDIEPEFIKNRFINEIK